MIRYGASRYQLNLVCHALGSVFPAAAKIAVLPAILAGIFNWAFHTYPSLAAHIIVPNEDELRLFINMSWVVGFVLVFRTSQSYARYWEAATQVHTLSAEWYDACTMIVGFALTSPNTQSEVDAFAGTIVRLFSLLHCSALQQISVMGDDRFHVIDVTGLGEEACKVLKSYEVCGTQDERREKTEIIFQWLVKFVLTHINSGVIATPAPIVTRAFQQLNSGMVSLSTMLAITDTPFPFPYAQIVTVFLLIYMVLTPLVVASIASHWVWAGVFTFLPILTQWAINITASEIEQPFGDDFNDFDLWEIQDDWNTSVLLLLDPITRIIPSAQPITNTNVQRLSVSLYASLSFRAQSFEEQSQKDPRLVSKTRSAPKEVIAARHATKDERWSYRAHSPRNSPSNSPRNSPPDSPSNSTRLHPILPAHSPRNSTSNPPRNSPPDSPEQFYRNTARNTTHRNFFHSVRSQNSGVAALRSSHRTFLQLPSQPPSKEDLDAGKEEAQAAKVAGGTGAYSCTLEQPLS